jgi:2,4-dienoyl-CoA reductase-like NADH-dependent reductase (Old Yellow Enzyme family)
MRSKLLTPINFGVFDLRHRCVVDWSLAVAEQSDDPSRAAMPIRMPQISGGLVVHDPGPLIWVDASPVTAEADHARAMAWRAEIDQAKSLDQCVVARLAPDLRRLSPYQAHAMEALSSQPRETIINIHAAAARRAVEFGFDGIELDASMGSVTDRVLRSTGGSTSSEIDDTIGRRVRFLTDLVSVLTQSVGHDRVGVRLAPFQRNDTRRSPNILYQDILGSLQDQEIAYVHVVGAQRWITGTSSVRRLPPAMTAVRRAYSGILVSSGRPDFVSALALVESRWADAICFSAASLDAKILLQIQSALAQGNGA